MAEDPEKSEGQGRRPKETPNPKPKSQSMRFAAIECKERAEGKSRILFALLAFFRGYFL
jgi:hypothetical protein